MDMYYAPAVRRGCTHTFSLRGRGSRGIFFHLAYFLFISFVFNRLVLHCNPTFLYQFYDHFNTSLVFKREKGKIILTDYTDFFNTFYTPLSVFLLSFPWTQRLLIKRNEELLQQLAVGDLQGFHHVSQRKSSLSLWFERKALGKEGSFCQKSW